MSWLRTRTPSGQVAWPLILLEGDEKAGKSYAAYSLSADERVGRTFVFEFGEGIADEYAQLGPYEIVDHNGTYADLLGQVEAACEEPTEPGKPNVVVIDQMTELWDLLNSWAEHRARGTKTAQRKLKDDPDAEIDITPNLHNDKADRWYRVLNTLRRSDVVGVLVCRGKEVTKFKNGQPVAGETDYSIQGHKGTPFAVKAHVRMTKPHTATLIGVNSLNVDLPTKGRRLSDSNPLGELVFDILGCGADSVARPVTRGSLGIPVTEAQNKLLELVARHKAPDPKVTARAIWDEFIPKGVTEVPPDQLAHVLDVAADRLENEPTPSDDDADPINDQKAKEAFDQAHEEMAS